MLILGGQKPYKWGEEFLTQLYDPIWQPDKLNSPSFLFLTFHLMFLDRRHYTFNPKHTRIYDIPQEAWVGHSQIDGIEFKKDGIFAKNTDVKFEKKGQIDSAVIYAVDDTSRLMFFLKTFKGIKTPIYVEQNGCLTMDWDALGIVHIGY